MALIPCPECQFTLSDRQKSCPRCGCRVSKRKAAVSKSEPVDNNYIKAKLGFFEEVSGWKLNEKIVCPHCQKRGCVATKQVKVNTGISGAKATAAILTDGWSLPFTGLSRKASVTGALCKNCGSKWAF
jgi:hypothetical protein